MDLTKCQKFSLLSSSLTAEHSAVTTREFRNWLQLLVSSLVSQYISKAPVHKSPAPRPLNKQISFQQLSEDWRRQWQITDGRRKARYGDGKCSVSQWRRRTRDVRHHTGGWPWARTTAADKTEVVGQIARCSAVQALVNQCRQLESDALPPLTSATEQHFAAGAARNSRYGKRRWRGHLLTYLLTT